MSSHAGTNVRHTPRHDLVHTANVDSRSVHGPFVTVYGSFGRIVPKRIRLGGMTRLVGSRIHGTNNAPVRFGLVNIYSNVTVTRRNVGFSLTDHRLVTSSIRAVLATRTFSTYVYVPGYSGVIPNVIVKTLHYGVPAVFYSNNPVTINGNHGKRSLSLGDIFRTITTYATNGVSRSSLRCIRYGTYPNTNSYSNVFATGSVGYLYRMLNLTLPNGNALLTLSRRQGRF